MITFTFIQRFGSFIQISACLSPKSCPDLNFGPLAERDLKIYESFQKKIQKSS